jgi:hypothetical protein
MYALISGVSTSASQTLTINPMGKQKPASWTARRAKGLNGSKPVCQGETSEHHLSQHYGRL